MAHDREYVIRVTNLTRDALPAIDSVTVSTYGVTGLAPAGTGVPAGETTYYTFTLSETTVTDIQDDGLTTPVVIVATFGTGTEALTVDISSSVQDRFEEDTRYTFTSGIRGRFMVTPSDTNDPQPVTVGGRVDSGPALPELADSILGDTFVVINSADPTTEPDGFYYYDGTAWEHTDNMVDTTYTFADGEAGSGTFLVTPSDTQVQETISVGQTTYDFTGSCLLYTSPSPRDS